MATADIPPHTSIIDTGGEWLIELDVADFTPGELRVETDGTALSVAGNRPCVGPFELEEHLDESLRLPPGADPDRAHARYSGGTLEIRLPKRSTFPRVIPIEHEHLVHAEATPC
jgi:HSP20 family molecular chaperone IbpA